MSFVSLIYQLFKHYFPTGKGCQKARGTYKLRPSGGANRPGRKRAHSIEKNASLEAVGTFGKGAKCESMEVANLIADFE